MNAHDLFRLGRWLTKIGEEAMRPTGAPVTPPGVRLILMDVFAAPDSSIGEIAARTGLPQSYVSESVARLREQGVFDTGADPADRRRTLVRVNAAIPKTVARLGAVSADKALVAALGDPDPDTARAIVQALETIAARLGQHMQASPGSP